MLDKFSSYQSNPSDPSNRTDHTDRTRPVNVPKDDSFRKSMKDRRQKNPDHVDGKDEHEDSASSVFDLSRKKSIPTKTSPKTLKEPGTPDNSRAIMGKKGQDQGQDQDLNLFARQTEGEDTEFTGEESGESGEPVQLAPSDELPEAPQTPPPEPKKMQTPKTPKSVQPQQPEIPQSSAERDAAALKALAGKKSHGDEKTSEISETPSSSKKQKTSSKDDTTVGNPGEKGELAGAVNSSIQAVNFQSEKSGAAQEPIRSSDITDIANQIVDRIQIMQKGDETQTTITLRQPPVLAGATITLTGSEHAKREFNISFNNLTPEAKIVIDRKLREDPLTDRLKDEGITVHMLTTSTKPIESIIGADGADQTSRDRQDQRQQQQEQQQQQKKRQVPSPDDFG